VYPKNLPTCSRPVNFEFSPVRSPTCYIIFLSICV
jgi:hypothetical protein